VTSDRPSRVLTEEPAQEGDALAASEADASVVKSTQIVMATATLTKSVKQLLFDVNGNFNLNLQSKFAP
jgi:hypothetical protein